MADNLEGVHAENAALEEELAAVAENLADVEATLVRSEEGRRGFERAMTEATRRHAAERRASEARQRSERSTPPAGSSMAPMRDDLLAARARNVALRGELAEARAKLTAAEKVARVVSAQEDDFERALRKAREEAEREREYVRLGERSGKARSPALPREHDGDFLPDEPNAPGLIATIFGLLSSFGDDD